MADPEKPARRAILNIRTGNNTSAPTQTPSLPPTPQKPDRTSEQLRPLAKRVAENAAIMRRFYQARGSDNEALAREVLNEIRNYSRTLDPTISHVEGARLVLILEEMFPRGNANTEIEPKQ